MYQLYLDDEPTGSPVTETEAIHWLKIWRKWFAGHPCYAFRVR